MHVGEAACVPASPVCVTAISKLFPGWLGDTEGDDCEENNEEMILRQI